MKSNRITWGLLTSLVLTAVVISAGQFSGQRHKPASKVRATPSPPPTDARDLSKYGSVEYAGAESAAPDDARLLVNRRYDNQGWVFKSVANNPEAAGVGKVTDNPPPPLYPIEESNLVVVGNVTNARAFLSGDKSGVYTEFEIRVEEVLKGDGKAGVQGIAADREGGVLIYPNGQRILYQNSTIALPLRGSKYLLFLKKRAEGSNYEIITSYNLSSTSIYPLEIVSAFEKFKGTTKSQLIDQVRDKIAQIKNH